MTAQGTHATPASALEPSERVDMPLTQNEARKSAHSGADVWTLVIPAPTTWLSMNQRLHWAKKAQLTKTWRLAASLAARKAGLPKGIPHVHITATVTKPSRRAFDVHNLLPSLKAAIDGLVDYGLIEDDSTKFLTGPDMRVDPDVGPAAVVLTITAIA